MNDFGEKVIMLLKKNNIIQKELADRIGITEVSLSRYISGNRIPKGTVVANIANALHTTTDYLLESEVKENEPYRIDQNIILKSIVYYGEEIQSTVCMEECAELIQAISKAKRGKINRDNMIEEIADVLICIEMLKQMYMISDEKINKWIEKKQAREAERRNNND